MNASTLSASDCITYIHKFNNNQRFNSIWWKWLLPSFSLAQSFHGLFISFAVCFMFFLFPLCIRSVFVVVWIYFFFFFVLHCLCTERPGATSVSLLCSQGPSWLLFIVYAGNKSEAKFIWLIASPSMRYLNNSNWNNSNNTKMVWNVCIYRSCQCVAVRFSLDYMPATKCRARTAHRDPPNGAFLSEINPPISDWFQRTKTKWV